MEPELTARIIAEHKERYVILTESGPVSAEITGNMRYTATQREDFPAVGDVVGYQMMDAYTAIIFSILPRKTLLKRKAVGKAGEAQVIAANIDLAFILQAAGHDFNLKRLERYLTACHSAGIRPCVVLTKTDLISQEEQEDLVAKIQNRVHGEKVIAISSQSGQGIGQIQEMLTPDLTCCFLGSSGVGKSTLINRLAGQPVMETREISVSTAKGKHTTSHRELILLPSGCALIDTPGMRDLGMTDDNAGMDVVFEEIASLGQECRFSDCTHQGEPGCAVMAAVEARDIPPGVLDNYLKLKREQQHYASSVQEKRQKDREFGKMVNEVKKLKNNEI